MGDIRQVTAQSMESFHKVSQVAAWLDEGRNVMVHCAAGLHRTGVFLYLLLRTFGNGPDKAKGKLGEIRHASQEETQQKRLYPDAERIYKALPERRRRPQTKLSEGSEQDIPAPLLLEGYPSESAQDTLACGSASYVAEALVEPPQVKPKMLLSEHAQEWEGYNEELEGGLAASAKKDADLANAGHTAAATAAAVEPSRIQAKEPVREEAPELEKDSEERHEQK